ncbi:MAG: LysM peptidoglycan-binding domain-containing protein [Myxococcales bacterium]|nr:LysM peptidoglycan-binding domain-containing protein [Myxococcales bacterium]
MRRGAFLWFLAALGCGARMPSVPARDRNAEGPAPQSLASAVPQSVGVPPQVEPDLRPQTHGADGGAHADVDAHSDADADAEDDTAEHVAADEDPDLFADAEPSPVANTPPPVRVEPPPSTPKTGALALSDAELRRKVFASLAQLGSISVGRPSAGALFNGVQLASGARWKVSDPGNAWGTRETADSIERAIGQVEAHFAGTPPLAIGHLSARRGGSLAPHRSHQSGRDVDLGYYYKTALPFYTRATADNLDTPRTWALVRAFVTETDVEYVFIDTPLQRVLKEHALALGEDAAWLDDIFQAGGTGRAPLIRHVAGHDTHIHVRFFNPIAQELGRRVHPHLVLRGLIQPRSYHTAYRAKKGDTVNRLARRFGVSAAAIQKANRLRTKRLVKGRSYLIPRRGPVTLGSEPTKIPARRVPSHGPSRPVPESPVDAAAKG